MVTKSAILETPCRIWNIVRVFLGSLTIEPIIFLFGFCTTISEGAQQTTNIKILKVCRFELNYNETVCDNLGDEQYTGILTDIQTRLNNFGIWQQWLITVPGIFYSLIVGAISDRVGRKPLLFFPLLGQCLLLVGHLLNFIFLEALPLEAYTTDMFYGILGGTPVFYLGSYGYGTDISKPEERAYRLARLDGFETVGGCVGTLLSPVLFNAIGYYGTYSFGVAGLAASLLYLMYIVKESRPTLDHEPRVPNKMKCGRVAIFFYENVVQSVIDMMFSLFKKRDGELRMLIGLLLLIYAIFWCTLEELGLIYFYLLLKFPGYDGTDFAVYSVIMQLTRISLLLFVMPFITGKLKLHEALVSTGFCLIIAIGLVLSAISNTVWLFYVFQVLANFSPCVFPLTRSMFSKCVHGDEVGRVYSGIAFLSAVLPLISNPLFRKMYNATVETVPNLFLCVTAVLFLVCAGINLEVYFKRKVMKFDPSSEKPVQENLRVNSPSTKQLGFGQKVSEADSGHFVSYL